MQIRLEGLTKVFTDKTGKETVAVNNLDITIPSGKLVSLLGPSGCGKSTTLYMIAGLLKPSAGKIFFGNEDVTNLAPEKRGIGLVFQNYALYPHMNGYDNMDFGLKLRKFKKDEIDRRVKDAARILGLEAYLDRKPKALSGGQRQRVALGRAIVRDAKVFLMDEPLSNLDAKLRVQMRAEIQKLHHRLQTTTIYVTHDQTEAMTMATRLVVLKDGLIQQVGAPKEVYDKPNNIFVGGFIGSPAMNFFNGTLEEGSISLGETKVAVPEGKMKVLREQGYIGKEVVLGVRPEDIHDEPVFLDANQGSRITATIEVAELMGSESYLYSEVNGQGFVARVDSRTDVQGGEKIELAFDMNKCHFFDAETEERIK